MTLREWLEQIPPGRRRAFWKDCKIVDVDPVSERYVLVTVQIPPPVGELHRELASLDSEVEIKIRY
jgi:hypothetical protein